MQITIEDVTPFIDETLTESQTASVTAWLTAISAQLNTTFGYVDKELDPNVAPAIYSIAADAITRRLTRSEFDPRLRGQATGPSSVTYNVTVSQLSGWFYPDEALMLQGLLSGNAGGTLGSVRLSAPDAVRYGNLAPRFLSPGLEGIGIDYDDEFEDVGGDVIDWDNNS